MNFFNFRRVFSALMLCAAILAYPAVSQAAEKQKSEWLIYLYLVGSDLETKGAAASEDLDEIMSANPGKDVRILIETGGSRKWHKNISNKELGRYTIEKQKLVKLGSVPNAPMGEAENFTDFIKWGESNYEAKHRMVIFWNHGGGPTGGVGYDENFEDSFLKMDEVNGAMLDAFGEDSAKFFDIIGFDACLMANFNVATLMSPFGRYMVASEEVEPGYGWTYDQWVGMLAKNPKMTPLEVSKAIVDTYIDYTSEMDIESTTLSVIDLDKFPQLALAMMDFSNSVGNKVINNRKQLNFMERVAQNDVQLYGSTKKQPNCAESVDMAEFVDAISGYDKKNAEKVLNLIDETVVYKKNGEYRSGEGLAMYYPISKDTEKYASFVDHSINTSFSKVYGSVMNVLDDELLEVLNEYQDNGTNYINYLAQMDLSGEEGSDEDEDSDDSDAAADTDEEDDDSSDEDEDEDENEGSSSESSNASSSESGSGSSSSAVMAGLGSVLGNHSTSAQSSGSSLFGNLSQAIQTSAGKREVDEAFKSIEDIAPKFNKNGHSYVTLSKEQLDSVSRVDIAHMLIMLPEKETPEGVMIALGMDETLKADWDKGVFTDTVDNTWICLDGEPVSVSVTNSTADYIFYESPIKLNGEDYIMEIIYSRKNNDYKIIGLQSYNDDGLPERVNTRLKPGDKIVPVFTVYTLTGDNDKEVEMEMDAIVYKKDSKITRESMGENSVAFTFMFYDAAGDNVSSDMLHMSADDNDNIILKPLDTFLEENSEQLIKYMKDDE